MTRRLVISYLAVTLFVLLVLEVPLAVVFDRAERSDLLSRVKQDALVFAQPAKDMFEGERGASTELAALALRYQVQTGGRVIVVDTGGHAVIDPAAEGGSFTNRNEITQALGGRIASGWRHSGTLGADLLYVAVPVAASGKVIGVVRITFPASTVTARIHRTWLALGGIAAIIMAVVFLLSIGLARSVTGPLRRVTDVARRLGRGELQARAEVTRGPPELTALADILNDTAARLEMLVTAQQAFVADASHQLRNPLAALRLHLENLDADVTGEAAEDVRQALAEVMRLSRLVDGLLALARSEAPVTERRSTDIAAVVTTRATVWEPLASEHGVRIVTDAADHARALVTDGHLEQVLDNLIANALDATPDGTEVAITARRSGTWVEIHILDHGPGLPPEDRARAASRYWRSDAATSGSFGGTGLGLAIAHRLITADRGELRLGDTPGGGLDVTIRLPAAADRDVATKPETPKVVVP